MNNGDTAPLEGIRVVSLAPNLPGPAAGRRLAALGAEVVKVEAPTGDPMAAYNRAWYEALNAGQQIVVLDLKSAEGRESLHEHLTAADLLLTSSRPAALERMDLGWESLRRRHPRLCLVRIVGHSPPHDGVPGHDLTYQMEAGLVADTTMPRTLLADLGGAERAVTAALALLLQRQRGGEAGCETVALAEAAEIFAEPLRYGATGAGGLLGGGIPEYGLYACADGIVAVACLEPHFRDGLRNALGLTALSHDGLATRFREGDAAAWNAWARERDLPLVASARP